MILTLPILITCWVLAVVGALIGVTMYVIRRRWFYLAYGYLTFGFCALALPFKIGLPATSGIGMAFLTLVWPVWLGQSFGYHVLDYMPEWFLVLLFNI